MTEKTVYVATIQENPEKLREKIHAILKQYFYGKIEECMLIHQIVHVTGYRNPDDWTYQDFNKVAE